MGKFFHLGKKVFNRPRHRTTRRLPLGLQAINIIMVVAILLVGFAYMIEVNGLVAKSYVLKDLESQLSDLQQQSERLNDQVSELQSLETVRRKLVGTTMIPAEKPEFLQPNQVAFAGR